MLCKCKIERQRPVGRPTCRSITVFVLSVCLSVGNDRVLRKNGWRDRAVVWGGLAQMTLYLGWIGSRSPTSSKISLEGNGAAQCRSMEKVALWCGCSVPAAEWLDSSAVGCAQLAHAADESILCRYGWRRGLFSNYSERQFLPGRLIMQRFFGEPRGVEAAVRN